MSSPCAFPSIWNPHINIQSKKDILYPFFPSIFPRVTSLMKCLIFLLLIVNLFPVSYYFFCISVKCTVISSSVLFFFFHLQLFTVTGLGLTHIKTKVESPKTDEESKKQETIPSPSMDLSSPSIVFTAFYSFNCILLLVSLLPLLTEQKSESFM